MADILELGIKLNAVFGGNFTSTFTEAGQSITQLQEHTRNLQKTAGDVSKFSALKDTITQNQSTMLDMSKAARNLSTDITANKTRTAELQGQYSALQQRQSQLVSMGKKNTETYRQITERMKTLKVEIKGNEQEGRKLEQQQAKLESGAGKLQAGLDRDRQSLVELRGALNNAGVDTGKLAQEQDRLQRELSESTAAQEKLQKAQARVESIRGQLSWGNMKGDIMASAGALMAFQKPVQIDMEFEQAMANVNAVASLTSEAFTAMRSQAMELGATTQFSASQAASTMEVMARAGMKADQVMGVMPSVLAMAAADGMDLASAGGILSNSLRGMGVDIDHLSREQTEEVAARYANILANTSASSNTNITEVGEAMKVAAPVMSQLGVTIEQLGAYIGGMANKGYTGSEAGNALASTAMRLNKLPKDTADSLRALGVGVRTKDGKMRELPDIMKAINKAFEDRKMGESERVDYLARIFGQGHGKAMMGLMSASVSGEVDTIYNSHMTEAQANGGKAQAMANIRNDTLQGDITSLGSAWEGLMINIGQALEPVARFITQTLTEGISKVNQFMREHETLCTWVTRIAAGFAAMKVVMTVWKYGSLLCQLPFAKIAASLAAGQAQAVATGGSFSALGSMVKGVWGVIAAHPFVAIAAAVGAAAVVIYQNWDTIKEYAAKTWEAVKAGWQAFSDWWGSWSFSDVFAPVADMAGRAWEGIKSGASAAYRYISAIDWGGIWNGIKDTAASAWENVKAGWNALTSWFSSWTWPDVFAGMRDMAAQSVEWFKGLFSGFADWITGVFSKLNPFNWELPSWLGGGQTPEQTQKRHDTAMNAIDMAFGAPAGIARHAVGGIMTTPHLGLVAEAGAEAIIPLTDKSRGVQVLLQAAEILGVTDEVMPAISRGGAPVSSSVINSLRTVEGNSDTTTTLTGITNALTSNAGNTSTLTGITNALTSTAGNTSTLTGITNALTGITATIGGDIFSSALELITGRTEVQNDTRNNNGVYNSNDNISRNSNMASGSPVINITVDGRGDNTDEGLAERIARAVSEAWQNLQEREGRLAYA